MTNWNFFDHKVCLSVQDDEWALAQREFERVSLSDVERYQAVKEIGPHQSFSHSERNILLDFLHSRHATLLHLEDDVSFRDLSHLDAALAQLPNDWDIIYLGANLVQWNNGEPRPERYGPHLFRVTSAWTTHAIGYNRKCVEFVLAQQPGFSERMFDNYLSDRLPELNAYIVSPMVAYQRPRKSLIWDRYDDYTPIFEASDAKLV